MVKRAPNFALVIALLVIANVTAYWFREKPMPVSFGAQLQSFPLKLGDWEGHDLDMTSEVRETLNADSLLSRAYTNIQTGESAGLLVVYRKYGRRDFIHRPELCYPSQGWKIVETSTMELSYDGKKVDATKVVAENEGDRDIIVYWFASGDRTEGNAMRQQFRMALDRFQPQKYGWAFIRINCPVMGDDEEAIENIRTFVRTISGPLVDRLTAGDEAQ